MPALQREIVDDRRYGFGGAPFHSGVGSLGVFGLRSGLTGSEAGSGVGEVVVRPQLAGQQYVNNLLFPDAPRLVNTENVRTEARAQTSGLREREWEWRRTHAAMLRRYENEWVVLEGETIVAHGSDPTEVIQEARRNNIQNPYIFFVEQNVEDVVRIGL
jgi:hypothetical protein